MQPLLTPSTALPFSPYPSHLLFLVPPLTSQPQLTFITYARTCTQGRTDRNPHLSKEEEETRKTARDDDAWLIDSKEPQSVIPSTYTVENNLTFLPPTEAGAAITRMVEDVHLSPCKQYQ